MENHKRISERAYYLAQEDSTRTDEENWRMAEAAELDASAEGVEKLATLADLNIEIEKSSEELSAVKSARGKIELEIEDAITPTIAEVRKHEMAKIKKLMCAGRDDEADKLLENYAKIVEKKTEKKLKIKKGGAGNARSATRISKADSDFDAERPYDWLPNVSYPQASRDYAGEMWKFGRIKTAKLWFSGWSGNWKCAYGCRTPRRNMSSMRTHIMEKCPKNPNAKGGAGNGRSGITKEECEAYLKREERRVKEAREEWSSMNIEEREKFVRDNSSE